MPAFCSVIKLNAAVYSIRRTSLTNHQVRKALWKKRGITVAVKVLKESPDASDEGDSQMQAFIDEGKTMVGLKHAFVVKLMGVVQRG